MKQWVDLLKNNLYLYFLTNKQKINPFFHFLVHAQIKVNQVMKLTSVFMYSFLMSIFVLSFCKSCCPTFLYEPSTNNVHSYGQILLQWNLMHSRLEILRSIKESTLRTQIFLRWYWLFKRDFWENFRPGRLIEQDA